MYSHDLTRSILLDNSEIHLKYTPFNTLLLPDWVGDDEDDDVLKQMQSILVRKKYAHCICQCLFVSCFFKKKFISKNGGAENYSKVSV